MKIVRLTVSILACSSRRSWRCHVQADVTLPSLLADHMVVQRGFPCMSGEWRRNTKM